MDSSENRLDRIERLVEQNTEQIANTQRQIDNTQRQLDRLVGQSAEQFANTQRQIDSTQRQIDSTQRQIDSTQRQIEITQRQVDANTRATATLAQSMQELILIQQQESEQFNRSINSINAALERIDRILDYLLRQQGGNANP